MSRKETREIMSKFLAKEEAEVAEDLEKRGKTGNEAKFIADQHRLTLSEIATEAGFPEIAQEYRRKIGD
jgi:hypothetical protein